MSEVLGTITYEQVLEMKRRGLTPQQASDAIFAEAKRRYPGYTILLEKHGNDRRYFIVGIKEEPMMPLLASPSS